MYAHNALTTKQHGKFKEENKMIDENVLRDDWLATGSDYAEFKNLLTDLSDCTSFVRISPMTITLYSFHHRDENVAYFYELIPAYTGEPRDSYKSLKKLTLSKVLAKGDHAAMMDETFSNVGMIFVVDGNTFFPAKKVVTRGLVPFGAGGLAISNPSFERDLYIASLFKDSKKCTFIIREISGVKKLVAILSSKYTALPQSALCDIIDVFQTNDDFGKMDTYMWNMSNWTSEIYVEFPERAKEIKSFYDLPHDFVPGLWLRTSDTGDSSITIYPTWRHGRSISYVEKAAVKKVHSRNVDLTDIISKVSEKAFSEYAKLPSALCELMALSLTNETLDLTNQKDVEKNKKAIEESYKRAFKQLDITKAIGKGYEKSLREQLCDEIDGAISYTAYDIATNLMSLPERLEGINAETKHKLESAVSNAPYISYRGKPKESLILV